MGQRAGRHNRCDRAVTGDACLDGSNDIEAEIAWRFRGLGCRNRIMAI